MIPTFTADAGLTASPGAYRVVNVRAASRSDFLPQQVPLAARTRAGGGDASGCRDCISYCQQGPCAGPAGGNACQECLSSCLQVC
jgi:hypothetical protein